MSRLIHESHYDIGGYRDVYEDRVRTQQVVTGGGVRLTAAAVADGVGGENKGERASQTAIDGFFTYLERSRDTDIPTLLIQAVRYANKVVHQLQKETSGASTTLTVAVVEETTRRLYIANVGDSRVYLCRNKKLTQLTIDHSFANVMPWQGKISREAAASHPRSQALMRAIGPKPDVEVDLGFYVNTTDQEEANARAKNGLQLQERDSVLVCSDGLIKDNPQGQLLITDDEIIRTLTDKEGKTAAKELVSFALGRGPDDNISAAVIQMPDRRRAWRARLPYIFLGTAIVGLMCVLSIVGTLFLLARSDASALAEVQTATAAIVQTISAYTPTPSNTPTNTSTPTPTLPPFVQGQAGIILTSDAPSFTINQNLPAPEPDLQLNVYHKDGFTPPGYLFAFPGSLLRFDSVDDQFFQFSVTQGSHLFVETGHYIRAVLKPVNAASLTLAVEGSCLALDDTLINALLVSCYEGQCTYDVLGGASGTIPAGQQILLDTSTLSVLTTQTIPESEARAWATLLPAGSAAQNCASQFVPTPTPTPTKLTVIVPTKTPNPSGNSGGSEPDPPTNTPVPPTNPPAPTHTPRPTNTPPPTNTPAPGVTPPTSLPATKTPTRTNTPLPPTPTRTPSPTFTSPPTATSTPPPSNTPQPTNTPPPTNTSQPTNTPQPTDTPEPTKTPKCSGNSCTPTPTPSDGG